MAKLDLDFILIDESVVDRGYRCLLSGAELSEFLANPIMLFMHNRAGGNGDDARLPIGKWYDVRIEDGKLMGKPDFDDDDEFALKIQKKVEKGYLNAASIWVSPKEASMEPMLMLEGQELPTITRWGVREASIVDIPGCGGAVALRNSSGRDVEGKADVENYLLKFLPQKAVQGMNTKDVALLMGMPENATDEQVGQKLAAFKLAAEAVEPLKSAKEKAEQDLEAMKLTANKQRVTDLVKGAFDAKKITATEMPKYEKLATADFDTTKELLDGMKGFAGITKLSGVELDEAGIAELSGLMKLSGNDLWMQGKLERVKELNEGSYKLKYKEAFGVDPK